MFPSLWSVVIPGVGNQYKLSQLERLSPLSTLHSPLSTLECKIVNHLPAKIKILRAEIGEAYGKMYDPEKCLTVQNE